MLFKINKNRWVVIFTFLLFVIYEGTTQNKFIPGISSYTPFSYPGRHNLVLVPDSKQHVLEIFFSVEIDSLQNPIILNTLYFKLRSDANLPGLIKKGILEYSGYTDITDFFIRGNEFFDSTMLQDDSVLIFTGSKEVLNGNVLHLYLDLSDKTFTGEKIQIFLDSVGFNHDTIDYNDLPSNSFNARTDVWIYRKDELIDSFNLVLNPSFEKRLTSCIEPAGPSTGIGPLASSWWRPHSKTADPYCNGSTIFQMARTGMSMVGIGLINYSTLAGNPSEYIAGNLSHPLEKNRKYCAEVFVNLADNSKWSTDDISILLNNNRGGSYSILDTSWFPLKFNPQIKSTQGVLIEDTMNWVSVSGDFIAKGDEKYIHIGSFLDTNITLLPTPWGGIPIGGGAYYYIDDVSLKIGPKQVPDTIFTCDADSISLGEKYPPNFNYRWLHSGETKSQIWVQESGLYQLEVLGGCEIFIDSFYVFFGVNAIGDIQICKNDFYQLSVTGGNNTYVWSPDYFIDDITSENPIVSPIESTNYIVSSNNCKDTVRVLVDSSTLCEQSTNIFIPNALVLSHSDLLAFVPKEAQLLIYNRLGKLIFNNKVYTLSDIKHVVQVGQVYLYQIIYLSDGEIISRNGNITVTN